MIKTNAQALDFISENDVKFIELAFSDAFGIGKTASIMPREFVKVLENGLSIGSSSLLGFVNDTESELFLFPDINTLSIMSSGLENERHATLFCEIRRPDGSIFDGDGRAFLKNAVDFAKTRGFDFEISIKSEFHIFETDDKGMPTNTPLDRGGFCDIAPLDKCKKIRKMVCQRLEDMDIEVESACHSNGAGQNLIVLNSAHSLKSADDFMTLKSIVKQVSMENKAYATFMPVPILDSFGNGLNISMTIQKIDSEMQTAMRRGLTSECENFIAGIMNRIGEITLFLNPLTNSYKRLGRGDSPKYISWSHQSLSQLIRIPSDEFDLKRVEISSPDTSCNPYIAIGLLIYAGLQGQDLKLRLPESVDINLNYATDEFLMNFKRIPDNLEEAVSQAVRSKFLKEFLPKNLLKTYTDEKHSEWMKYLTAKDKDIFESEKYFLYF